MECYHSPRWPWKHFTRSTLAPGVWKHTNTHRTRTLTLIITYTAQPGTPWPPLCSEKHTQPSFCLSGPAVAPFATGYRCSWCQLTNHWRAGCCRSRSPAFCFPLYFSFHCSCVFKDADVSVCVELRWMLWTLDPTGVCLKSALRVDLVLLFCFLQGQFVLCVYIVCAPFVFAKVSYCHCSQCLTLNIKSQQVTYLGSFVLSVWFVSQTSPVVQAISGGWKNGWKRDQNIE